MPSPPSQLSGSAYDFHYDAKLFLVNKNLLYPEEKTYGQEFGGPLNLAALCGRIGRILAKAGSAQVVQLTLTIQGHIQSAIKFNNGAK